MTAQAKVVACDGTDELLHTGPAAKIMGQPASGAAGTFAINNADASKSATDNELRNRVASLEAVLACEARIRSAANETELCCLLANELRKLSGARQIFVLRAKCAGEFVVQAVSSVAVVERDTPFIRWTESLVRNLMRETGGQRALAFELPAFTQTDSQETMSYPFGNFVWQPLQLKSREVFAGILVARERPWGEQEVAGFARPAENAAVAWASIVGVRKLRVAKAKRSWFLPIMVASVLLISVLPVPMTTLAPVEIIAADPHRVTTPLDGVIAEIPIGPNRAVKAGDIILRFDDTTLSNQLKVSEQELRVAQSRYDRAQQAAFYDDNARHELAITHNEFRLKQAERNYARSQLAKTVVRARRDGVLIYEDRSKLVGRPVNAGESLMEIADPAQIAARIELPVADAIVLENDTTVRLFLDSDPLTSLTAKLTAMGYKAKPNGTQQLVYSLMAKFGKDKPKARIGARGTAQLSGERVPVIYFVLRRPIAALRQYIGL